MNIRKEARAGLAFGALLCVCMFTEPFIDHLEARAVDVQPEPSRVVVEVTRVEQLPIESEAPAEASLEVEEETDTFVNDTPLTDSEYRALLEACEENRIAPSLALGLIQVESRFDKNARSRSGCYGYCQLNPRYFPTGLSPEDNIRTGIAYLGYQCERYGNTESGLTAYNAGHDTGDLSYARAVLQAAERWD